MEMDSNSLFTSILFQFQLVPDCDTEKAREPSKEGGTITEIPRTSLPDFLSNTNGAIQMRNIVRHILFCSCLISRLLACFVFI